MLDTRSFLITSKVKVHSMNLTFSANSTTLTLPRCSDDNDHSDGGVAVELADPMVKRPPKYAVIMLNDDYTPMEFVVLVLEQYFSKDRSQATQIMMTIHTKGSAVCGLFSKDIAETKAYMVNKLARESEHPLLCEVEAAPDDE